MGTPALTFDLLPGELAIVRLDAAGGVPAWAMRGEAFWSVSRRGEELSVMCAADAVPAEVAAVGPYRALAVRGPMAFDVVGVAAAFTAPLAAAGVPVMPVATHDTDVVLLRAGDLDRGVAALRGAGFTVAGG